MVTFSGFRRMVISPDALEENEGRRIEMLCRSAGIHVDIRSEGGTPTLETPDTLVIAVSPPGGWITKAQHGDLSMRPNEYYLHPIEGCRSACSYCYLRGQRDGLRPLRLYVGISGMFEQIDRVIATGHSAEYLFCTGERADSLADIDIYPVASYLVDHFSSQRNARLELRTKSRSVEPLLSLSHGRRTTVSFSIAPAEHVARFEHGTHTLRDRLDAASKCQAAGYDIAFNMEPLILIEGWQEAYQAMLDELADTIEIDSIHHVNVGCLRFGAALEETRAFRQVFDDLVPDREYIKYRPSKTNGTYPFAERVAAYRYVAGLLRERQIRAPILWSLEEPRLLTALS
jgi:spore photoproduct lyase